MKKSVDTKMNNFNQELDEILNSLELPTDHDLKRQTTSQKLSLRFKGKTRPIYIGQITSKRNRSLYEEYYTYILRSPGNDLLKFYDAYNLALGKDNRAYSAIPPSVVFYYRFIHEYPDFLFDKSKNYGVNAYLRDKLRHLHDTGDNTYWAQVKNTRHSWLKNEPHQSYEFDYAVDLSKFLQNLSTQKSHNNKFTLVDNIESHLFLRGDLKGWSIVRIPKSNNLSIREKMSRNKG